MGLSFAARHRACWLVLIAFLYATLAPALNLAAGHASASRTVWVELCNATGHEFIAVHLPDEPAKAGHSAKPAGQCLLCVYPSTPPADIVVAVAPTTADFARPAIHDDPDPRRTQPWSPSLARAPPVLS